MGVSGGLVYMRIAVIVLKGLGAHQLNERAYLLWRVVVDGRVINVRFCIASLQIASYGIEYSIHEYLVFQQPPFV